MSAFRRLLLASQKTDKKLVNLFNYTQKTFPFESNGITYERLSDYTIRLNGTSKNGESSMYVILDFKLSHKYIIIGAPSTSSATTYRLWTNSSTAFPSGNRLADDGKGCIRVSKADESNVHTSVYLYKNVTLQNVIFKPMVFDLTDYFGAGNEPTTVSAFYAYFGATSIDDFPYIKP